MARAKRGVVSRARHKKVFKAVKGQFGRKKYNSYCTSSNGKSIAICIQR